MKRLPWVIAGLSWPLVLTGPPPIGTWACLAAIAATLTAALFVRVLYRWTSSRRRPHSPLLETPWLGTLSLLFIAAAWSGWHVERGLTDRWNDPPSTMTLQGRVVSLPERRGDQLRFVLSADASEHLSRPMRVEMRWFRPGAVPRAGERWQFRVRLGPSRGRLNFTGSDPERFWFAARIHALGSVLGNDAGRLGEADATPVQRVRETLRARLDRELQGLPGQGLIRALALGDRSGLSDSLQAAMRATGTGHLLAISGLHVGLVALYGTGFARLLLAVTRWRSRHWPARRLAPLFGLGAATGYALLAGFETSPRRALVMVSVVVVALVLRRRVSAWRSWLLALSLVLVLDPLAPLRAGFWLSFAAVGILLWVFLGRSKRIRAGASLLRAQLSLSLAMLPLSLAWFGYASISGLLVNLAAIPWVSLITLPVLLLGLPLLTGEGGLETLPLHVAAQSAAWLESGLVGIHERWGETGWSTRRPETAMAVLATLGALLCLLPSALRLRGFGVLLMAPMVLGLLSPALLPPALLPPALLSPAQNDPPGAVAVEVLDVGQGQAVLVSAGGRRLLVDTGPGAKGRWSLAEQVLLPAVVDSGRARPDLVLLSHGDSDHAGGLVDLMRAWPGVAVSASLPHGFPTVGRCDDRRQWRWNEVSFQILHPTPWLPYLGNDSSCVLEIVAPGGAILLPGDIGRHVERRLMSGPAKDYRLASGIATGPVKHYRLMVAPHHGSQSSSSAEFLDWARPAVTVFSNAYGNRFGFPDERVLQRYAARAMPVTDTAACGGLRFVLSADGRLEARAARRVRNAFWRFPAAPHCPGPGTVGTLTSPNAFRYHAGHSENNLASKE